MYILVVLNLHCKRVLGTSMGAPGSTLGSSQFVKFPFEVC